ncbi:MAG: homocysteine S-methyltransferase family protein, partial [Clostridia bacterium]|nr:homocysteine S-methyltransferase family protein [Clostridia bacterium]
MKDVLAHIRRERTYFDGGFGTLLQAAGLPAGTPPVLWNLSFPDKVTEIHRAYIEAGSHIITTNTFGVTPDKYENYADIIAAAVAAARAAVGEREDVFIAFDMGPTGKLLAPLGELAFEDAVALYAASVKAAVEAGVDLIVIETMSDTYETKAAVLAAKENSHLPVFVTNAYDEGGKLLTGADVAATVALLEGLGVDALGVNCSFGPDKMLQTVKTLARYSSLPIIVNPNAGLPRVKGGRTVYDISPDAFAAYMRELAMAGATVLGGCCGTTPLYIEKTV